MDIDFSVEVKHTWIHERPYKVTLTRGASGQYRWEIEVRGTTAEHAFMGVQQTDDRLCKQYAAIEPTDQE